MIIIGLPKPRKSCPSIEKRQNPSSNFKLGEELVGCLSHQISRTSRKLWLSSSASRISFSSPDFTRVLFIPLNACLHAIYAQIKDFSFSFLQVTYFHGVHSGKPLTWNFIAKKLLITTWSSIDSHPTIDLLATIEKLCELWSDANHLCTHMSLILLKICIKNLKWVTLHVNLEFIIAYLMVQRSKVIHYQQKLNWITSHQVHVYLKLITNLFDGAVVWVWIFMHRTIVCFFKTMQPWTMEHNTIN